MKRCWFSIQNIWPDWLVFGSWSFLGVSVTCVTCINLISDFDGGFGRLIWRTFFIFIQLIDFAWEKVFILHYSSIHSFIHNNFVLFMRRFFWWDKRGLKYGSRLMIILGIRFFCFWYVVSSLRRWPLRERALPRKFTILNILQRQEKI